ncbi:MAG: hypothetical protein EOP19_16130 [Hyphomicrobiales bacterium]|nr:MAG: hypothetical protein EOP19_16130 [Hyphomicrobiales bacterium]
MTAAMAMSMASQPAQANSVVDEIGHFIECFGWMLTDPARQVAECGAGRPEVPLASLATPVDGPVFIADEPVIPEEEEPCPSWGSCEN